MCSAIYGCATRYIGGIHLHAVDEGREHPRLADVLGRDREQIAIENDEIGGLPDLERSGVPLAMVQRGPLDRVGPENVSSETRCAGFQTEAPGPPSLLGRRARRQFGAC